MIAAGPELRPQALLLTFFGGHVLDRGIDVATGSVLDVPCRAGRPVATSLRELSAALEPAARAIAAEVLDTISEESGPENRHGVDADAPAVRARAGA